MRTNGPAYAVGYLLSSWVSGRRLGGLVRLGLGGLPLLLALKQWRGRPQAGESAGCRSGWRRSMLLIIGAKLGDAITCLG